MHDVGRYGNIMVYIGKRALDIRERAKKVKNMQLFRVPLFLPLLVLSCWWLDDVYGCSGTGDCHHSGTCVTSSSTCNCTGTGYKGDTCDDDIDECKAPSSPCDGHANCTNTAGNYTCKCRSGFAGNGKTCTDIDECKATPCDGQANCTNTPGSYTCKCRSGFAGDGKTCTEDVCSKDGDECLNGGTCDTSKVPKCSCTSGYTGVTCQNAGGTVTISAYLLPLTVVTFFVIQ